jgi:hypothetical protein
MQSFCMLNQTVHLEPLGCKDLTILDDAVHIRLLSQPIKFFLPK